MKVGISQGLPLFKRIVAGSTPPAHTPSVCLDSRHIGCLFPVAAKICWDVGGLGKRCAHERALPCFSSVESGRSCGEGAGLGCAGNERNATQARSEEGVRGMLDVGFFVGLASVERITPKRRTEFWRDLMETGRGGNWKDFPNCLDGKQKEEKKRKLLKQHNCPKRFFSEVS